MKVVIVCGDVKPEVIIEVGGILSNCEINPDYDYSNDLERVEETYGREAVLDALGYLCGDNKLTEQANYFNGQLLTDEYSYFVERMIGASNENDDWQSRTTLGRRQMFFAFFFCAEVKENEKQKASCG